MTHSNDRGVSLSDCRLHIAMTECYIRTAQANGWQAWEAAYQRRLEWLQSLLRVKFGVPSTTEERDGCDPQKALAESEAGRD